MLAKPDAKKPSRKELAATAKENAIAKQVEEDELHFKKLDEVR